MSFTYNGNPGENEVASARFLIGDTDSTKPIMQDEEIQYLIDTYGSGVVTDTVRYHLFSRAATLFARDIKRSLGPQAEDPSGRLSFFASQAEYYKNMLTTGGVSLPTLSYPKIFRKGMMSNPRWPVPGGDKYVR